MTTRETVLAAIESHPGATREELLAITELTGSKFDPERMRLWLKGEIEPQTEEDWVAALGRDFEAVRWRRVEPDRRSDVAARAAQRKPRNAAGSPEERARKIVEQLDDPTVNRLVLEMTKDGQGSRRAQRRAEDALRRRHMEARAAAARAKREHATNADFLGLLRQLWDSRGAVNAIHVHLIEERARVVNGEARRISDGEWLTALKDVRTIVKTMGVMWQNVRDLGDPNEPCPACGAPQVREHHHLRVFAIDAEPSEEPEIVDARIVGD